MGVREHFGKVGWPNFAAVRLHIKNFFAAYESLRSDMKILKVWDKSLCERLYFVLWSGCVFGHVDISVPWDLGENPFYH